MELNTCTNKCIWGNKACHTINLGYNNIGNEGCKYLMKSNICVIKSDHIELDDYIMNRYKTNILKQLPLNKDVSGILIKLL